MPADGDAAATNDDAAKSEALTMIRQYDDEEIVFGRMTEGGSLDVSEFDMYRPDTINMSPPEMEDISVISGEFEPAPADPFPVFRGALRRFQQMEAKPRVVRIDSPETFGELVCDQACKELARRINELRALVEAHVADHHGGPLPPLRRWDVLGAAQAVARLKNATSPDDAVEALDRVPVDLPSWARNKVKCWRDGPNIVGSLRFQAADGSPRIATSAAQPRVDLMGLVRRSRVHPATLLGALPMLADGARVACAKRLVRDVAGAALKAQRRAEICGALDQPLLVASTGVPGGAPLAALMYLQQQCDAGDPQACSEMAIIERAAKTPSGQEIAAPMLAEAKRRLADARRAAKLGLFQRVAGWFR